MSVKEVYSDAESKMKKTIESTNREFSEVRTGRAHPSLVENIQVDYFGTPTKIKELGSISAPEPRSLVIQPWDPSVIPQIEKAISNSALALNPQNDGKIVRLPIPPLSEERRRELQKVVKDMAEKSRVSLRSIRRDANEKIKKLHSEKSVTDDESFKAQEDIQKLTDKFIKDVDHLLEEKSKALMELN